MTQSDGRKSANGTAAIPVLAHLDHDDQAAFEAAYADAVKNHPIAAVRQVLRRAGRSYAAAGWLLASWSPASVVTDDAQASLPSGKRA